MSELTNLAMSGERLPVASQEQWPLAPAGAPARSGNDLLDMVWRQRAMIAIITGSFMAIACLYLLLARPLYTGTSRLYIEQRDPVYLNDTRGIVPRSKNFLFTQCELIGSVPIITRALEQPNVKGMKMFEGVSDPLEFVRGNLSAGVGKKDDLIEVGFDAPYPDEAALMANNIVNAYISYQSAAKKNTAGEVLKVYEAEKMRREDELNKKVKQMLDFKQSNGTLSFEAGDKGNIILQRLTQLNDALTAAQLKTVESKTNYESALAIAEHPEAFRHLLEERNRVIGGQSVDRQSDNLQDQLTQLEIRLALAVKQLGPNHPSVQSARYAVEQLKGRIGERNKQFVSSYLAAAEQAYQSAKNSYLAAAEQAYQSAKNKEQEIAAALEEQKNTAMDLNKKATQFAMLDADVKRMEKLSEVLDSRIKDAQINGNAGALEVSVVEQAMTPDKPSKPRKLLILGLATILGMVTGLGGALVRGWTDGRIASADEILATLGMPVLCAIPHIRNATSPMARGQMVHLDPNSEPAEAYRAVRTSVDYHMRRAQAKTLLVTSPLSGDGKSTLVSNLAIAMAQAGDRTLVIDADLRHPSIHNIFQATSGPGLVGVLAGRSTVEKAVNGTTIDGLELLPCGPIPPNPSEILSSRQFAELLRLLGQQYDRILIDSPPVMPLADARSLAGLCDRTLLVLRANKSTRKASEDTCAALASVGARLLGVVVNDVSPRHGRYGYGYYKGNGHSKLPRMDMGMHVTPAPLPAPPSLDDSLAEETETKAWR
jgi:polysaccharide biosynthesis transport protein